MTLKAYVWTSRLLALLSLLALIFVLNKIDPDQSGWQGKAAFYFSLFFFLSGITGLALAFLRRKSLNDEAASTNAELSLRQGMLLALMAVAILILQSYRMLVWWDGLLIVAAVFLVELYFLSKN